MSQVKYLYWRPDIEPVIKGKQYCNVHYLVGYNDESVTAFQEMARELRKTFPKAKNSDIKCGKITKSSFHQGFSIVTWSGIIPKKEYKGWRAHNHGNMEYFW